MKIAAVSDSGRGAVWPVMRRTLGISLFALCCLTIRPVSFAWGQGDAGTDPVPERRNRSHFPLPADGTTVDPSKFLPEHFERAAKGSQALGLYRAIMSNPLNFDYRKEENLATLRRIAESIKNGELRLDPDDLLMQQLKKELSGKVEVPPELKKLVDEFQKNGGAGGAVRTPGVANPKKLGGDGLPAPGDQASPRPNRRPAMMPPPPVHRSNTTPSQESEDKEQAGWGPWFMKHAEKLTAKNGLIQSSPSLQKALQEFLRSGMDDNGAEGTSNRFGDELTRLVRKVVPENWWSRATWERLGKLQLPPLAPANLPDLSLPDVSSLDGFGSEMPSSSVTGAGATLIWVLGALFLGILTFELFKRISTRAGEGVDPAAALGPWPVAPAAVKSPQELVLAFEYLSLLKLGPKARTWNHRIIETRLGANREKQQMARHLANLYERARYAPVIEPLPAEALDAARHELLSLAGVASS